MNRRIVVLLSTLSLGACYVHAGAGTQPVNETVYESEPPPPPAPEVEVITVSPGPEFVWVGGYHRWDGHHYVWEHGRYNRRPHANARWQTAHWEARGHAHVWVEGRWQ